MTIDLQSVLCKLSSVCQDALQNPSEESLPYIDWCFYNWGEDSVIEQLKVSVTFDIDEMAMYKSWAFVDKIGNYEPVPVEYKAQCEAWAASKVDALVKEISEVLGEIWSSVDTKLLDRFATL